MVLFLRHPPSHGLAARPYPFSESLRTLPSSSSILTAQLFRQNKKSFGSSFWSPLLTLGGVIEDDFAKTRHWKFQSLDKHLEPPTNYQISRSTASSHQFVKYKNQNGKAREPHHRVLDTMFGTVNPSFSLGLDMPQRHTSQKQKRAAITKDLSMHLRHRCLTVIMIGLYLQIPCWEPHWNARFRSETFIQSWRLNQSKAAWCQFCSSSLHPSNGWCLLWKTHPCQCASRWCRSEQGGSLRCCSFTFSQANQWASWALTPF